MILFMDQSFLVGYLIYNAEKPLFYQELAAKSGVSANKIIRDVEKLRFSLPITWQLQYDKDKGLYFEKPEESNIKDLAISINETNQYFEMIRYIIEDNPISVEEVAEEFLLSRATVYRRISNIKLWAEKFNVQLETDKGVYFCGNELDIRSMYFQFYDFIIGDDFSQFIFFNWSNFSSTIIELIQKRSVSVSMGTVRRMMILLHVIHVRVSSRHNLSESMLRDSVDISEDIGSALKVYFPRSDSFQNSVYEIQYFNRFFSTQIILKNKKEYLNEIRSGESDYSTPIQRLIDELSSHFNVPFWNDDELMYALFELIKVNKLNCSFQINSRSNYLLMYYQIYKDDNLFELIENILNQDIFLGYLGNPMYKELNTLELYLMLKACVLKQREMIPLKMMILTQSEFGKTYMDATLINQIPRNTVVRFGNVFHSSVMNIFTDYDLILSTRSIPKDNIRNIPYYIIDTILTKKEVEQVNYLLNKIINEKLSITSLGRECIKELFPG